MTSTPSKMRANSTPSSPAKRQADNTMQLLPFKIGLRYSYARSGARFIGLNAILAVIGITIGIAALIVVLSVMNGVVTQVRDKMLSMTSHAMLRSNDGTGVIPPEFDPAQYLANRPELIAYAPYVQGQGLIGDSERFQGVVLQGVDPNEEGKVSKTFANLEPDMAAQLQAGDFNLILGEVLAKQINAKPGDKVTIIVPQVTASAAGLLPRIKRFTLIGTFSSGHYAFDNGVALVNLKDAAKLLQLPDGVTGYHIMLHDPMQAPLVRDAINPQLPPGVYASDWSLDNASYFSAVQTEKHAMFIILCLIVMVAAFGLLSSMYMVVTEKRRDIAILRTMGMTRRQIGRIFLTQGLTFGALGTVLGVSLGILIAINVPAIMAFLEKHTGYALPAQMYFINELPAKIDPAVISGISIVTLVLTLLFSVIPAMMAARTEPARALSHE